MKKSMAKVLAGALSLAMAVTLVTPSNAAAASKPKFVKTYGKLYSNAVYSVKNVKKGYKVKVSVHIPQELRIRSGGTERHSASN